MEETNQTTQSSQTVPNQTPPPSAPPLTPEQPKRNWVRILLFGIFGIVILSSLIFAGYQFKSSKISPTPVPSPRISTPTPTPDLTANWKTYESTELGFSIQYPPDLYELKINQVGVLGDWYQRPYIYLKPTAILKKMRPSALTYNMDIGSFENTKNLSLDNPKEQLFGKGPLIGYGSGALEKVEIKAVSLGGIKAYRVDHCCVGLYGTEADIMTIRDNKFYEILISQGEVKVNPSTENRQLFENILSTFKFTNDTATSTRLKVFQYKSISFNYPSDRTVRSENLSDGAIRFIFENKEEFSILYLEEHRNISENTKKPYNTLDEILSDNYSYKEYKWSSINLSGTAALRSPEMYFKTLAPTTEYIVYFFSKDKSKIYTISWSIAGGDKEVAKSFDELLSSFKYN